MEFNVNNSFFTGKFLIYLPTVDSTNSYAKDYITKTSPIDGTVILADEQLQGRGQSGNKWTSEANKNLTFSIIYQTGFLRATDQFYLNMAVSLGILSMVHSQWSILKRESPGAFIKWPNDIYVDSKKIAGILIENTISGVQLKHSVIGIGLNVNQEVFSNDLNATSLRLLLQKELDRNEILNELLSSIEKYYLQLKERKFESLKQEYLENLYHFNVVAEFKKNGENFMGKIIDITESGKLVMEIESGVEEFNFKEISFVH
ncbi:MAG: biotin biosynthesis protein BioC [Bacteroidota bacterium]|nr:biotin biosynthesis protein BioC [Bacteroidota bacterium]